MISQNEVDSTFFLKFGHCGEFTDKYVLDEIKSALETVGLFISSSEAHCFWRWRSAQYDASFLCEDPPEQIIEWFTKFVNEALQPDPNDDDRYDCYR